MDRLLSRFLVALIRVYQVALSPWLGALWLGQGCRFAPSCSHFAMQALRSHGTLRGSWLALCRLARCHPWSTPRWDPVPPKGRRSAHRPSTRLAVTLAVVAGLLSLSGLVWADTQAAPTSASATGAQLRSEAFVAQLAADGSLRSVRLLGERFRSPKGEAIDLVSTNKPAYLPMRASWQGIDVPDDAVWQAAAQPAPAGAVRFLWQGAQAQVERTVELGRAPYQLWSTWTVTNRSDHPLEVQPTFSLAHYVPRSAEGSSMLGARSPAVSFGLCQAGDDTVREDRDGLQGTLSRSGAVRFVGVENGHFTLAMAPDGAAAEGCQLRATNRGGTASDPHGSLFEAKLKAAKRSIPPGGQATFRILQYAGPKDLKALRAAGHELPKIIDFGFFSFLAKGLVRLLGWIEGQVGNWGLAIILLTVLVKLVLYPLTEKSFQSMARMRLLKPELDDIQERFKDDREKKGAAVMELYRKNKINPVGGCLPSLLQLPVWFSLYASLSTNVELYHAPFALWWQDLSAPDPFFVLPLLLGLLMFWQQKMTPTSTDPMQAKMMLYMMPVMVTAFMLFLPAGLCLYMATNSVLGIAQQKMINHRLERQAGQTQAVKVAEVEVLPVPPGTTLGSGRRRQSRGRA